MERPIALLVFCFCFSVLLSAQNEGSTFDRDTVHEIRFKFHQTGYWDSLVANKSAEIYMRCDVQIDGILYPNAGVRFKGNSSYKNSSTKKPFKIDIQDFGKDLETIITFPFHDCHQ